MTLQEMIKQCKSAIAHPLLGGDKAKVTFILRGQFTNSGKKKLINVKGAPMGKCVSDADDKHVMVAFSAKEVMRWAQDQLEAKEGL